MRDRQEDWRQTDTGEGESRPLCQVQSTGRRKRGRDSDGVQREKKKRPRERDKPPSNQRQLGAEKSWWQERLVPDKRMCVDGFHSPVAYCKVSMLLTRRVSIRLIFPAEISGCPQDKFQPNCDFKMTASCMFMFSNMSTWAIRSHLGGNNEHIDSGLRIRLQSDPPENSKIPTI